MNEVIGEISNKGIRNRIRRGILLAPVLLLLFVQICAAGEERSPETGLSEKAGIEVPDLSDVFETVLQLGNRLQDVMDEASLQRTEQRYVQEALGKQLLAAWNLTDRIDADTPWLIRVNQTTNTVTVYRVMQVQKEELPFSAGYRNIVRIAREKADEAEAARKKAEEEEAAHVLMEFRKIETEEEKAASSVTVCIPVYACPCSVGVDGKTPNGTFTIQDHLRWHELVGPTWGQWCCHFAPSFLFHSLPYDRPNDPNSLQEDVYNLLGQSVSHGCVRLAAVDAKYIYDHVPTGGKVEIFVGSEADDPLGTPERPFIGEWTETYDPTDPEFSPAATE